MTLNSGTSTLSPLEFVNGGGFDPDFGTVFSIINNDGADAVTGTFSNFADGADAITIDGHTLKVYYNADGGGDGNRNDVVIRYNVTGPASCAVSVGFSDFTGWRGRRQPGGGWLPMQAFFGARRVPGPRPMPL